MDEEVLDVIEEVTEPTVTPTQHRIARERKKLLSALGVDTIEEGQSLIEESSELVATNTALSITNDTITRERDEALARLAQIEKEQIIESKRTELKSRLVAHGAIDPELLISAINMDLVDGNYDEIVSALVSEKPRQFTQDTIGGDAHVVTPRVVIDPMGEAVENKDYDVANKLFLDNLFK